MGITSEFNFDDFYKFIISASLLAIVLSFVLTFFFENNLNWILFILVLVSSSCFILWARKRWYENQKRLDRKLKAECELSEREASGLIPQEKMIKENTFEKQRDTKIKFASRNKVALIEYKVDSVLPGTVPFNLLKDKKIWFWIANLEDKKYLAYVKIKIKIKDKEIYLDDNGGYYNGRTSWKLNAYTGIHAPGIPIGLYVEEIKNRRDLSITLEVEVKDENNKLIDKKLPVTYRYNLNNNSWFLEP